MNQIRPDVKQTSSGHKLYIEFMVTFTFELET